MRCNERRNNSNFNKEIQVISTETLDVLRFSDSFSLVVVWLMAHGALMLLALRPRTRSLTSCFSHVSLMFPSVCPMGSSSSSSRLFGTLAQSLNRAPLAQPDLHLEENPDQDLDQDLAEIDPDQLLRECEEALQRRPARPHRNLVYPNSMAPCHHKHNPSIRVMQWNILAQGTHLSVVRTAVHEGHDET